MPRNSTTVPSLEPDGTSLPVREPSPRYPRGTTPSKASQQASYEAGKAFYRAWALAAFGVVAIVLSMPVFVPLASWFIAMVVQR